MRLQIDHTTRYTYSKPVFIEPTTIRLRPLNNVMQRIERFDMRIDPQPTGMNDCIGIEGNDAKHAWFDGLHSHLTIVTSCDVETLLSNPYNHVLAPEATSLPMTYPATTASLLRAHLEWNGDIAVQGFANEIMATSGGETMAFLTALVQRIHQTVKTEIRDEGHPLAAAETLSAGRGACRDSAVLFMDACRAVGLAARFVSGYKAYNLTHPVHDLHAWAEVYLPGAGWRGFDTTEGLTVADRHVGLAAAAVPEAAAPVSGTFRGTDATASIAFEIQFKML